MVKTCLDLRANLISNKVNARPDQRESPVDPSFPLLCTCETIWTELKGARSRYFMQFQH